jgi:hypothetical protein
VYDQNQQMMYGAAGAYAAAQFAAAGECAPDAAGAQMAAPHVGFGYGGAPAGHGLAEMPGARY